MTISNAIPQYVMINMRLYAVHKGRMYVDMYTTFQ